MPQKNAKLLTNENLSLHEQTSSTITTLPKNGKALQLSEEHFVQTLEGCADAVVVSDSKGTILFF